MLCAGSVTRCSRTGMLSGPRDAGLNPGLNFTKTHMPTTTINHSYGEALEAAAKHGKRISREGWNGKGLFVFVQVPAEVPAEIIPKMSSLPNDVKAEFVRRGGSIRYRNQLAIVYPDGTVYGWDSSPSDQLENDWCIHHEEQPAHFLPAPVSETAGTAKPMT